jgi:hypothetical protein
MPHHPAALVIALSLLMISSPALAQTKPRSCPGCPDPTKNVCWGSFGGCDRWNPWPGQDWKHIGCWSGGSSGFNKDVACAYVCPDPKRCTVAPVKNYGGGECGWAWVVLTCKVIR